MCVWNEMNEAITAKLWNLVDIAHHKYISSARENCEWDHRRDEKGKQ